MLGYILAHCSWTFFGQFRSILKFYMGVWKLLALCLSGFYLLLWFNSWVFQRFCWTFRMNHALLSIKLTASLPLEIGRFCPKRTFHLPTIDFKGELLISGRVILHRLCFKHESMKLLARWIIATKNFTAERWLKQENSLKFMDVQVGKLLLMAEIRRSPVEVGSFSHDLQGFYISQVVSRTSGPSTVRSTNSGQQWDCQCVHSTRLCYGAIVAVLLWKMGAGYWVRKGSWVIHWKFGTQFNTIWYDLIYIYKYQRMILRKR